MKYNGKYGRWFTKGGLVYRYDSKQDKLILCKQCDSHNGYKLGSDSKGKRFRVHRAIYETFIGEIPDGYEIDHINTVRDDNRIDNLRAVTHAENTRNPLTRQHRIKSHINKIRSDSEFGKKYLVHFGYSYSENPKQYNKEYNWYRKYGKCRWE